MKLQIISLIVFLLTLCPQIWGANPLRVGIYDNPPKVFLNEENHPTGFFVDIFEEIRQHENYEVEYVFAQWSQLLEMLKDGQIDVLIDVAYSADRAQKFMFNNVPVIESWLQFYSYAEDINQISDINNRNIAVLKGSMQYNYLNNHFHREFDITYQVIEFEDYNDFLRISKEGKVDLLLADRFFYFAPHRDPPCFLHSIKIRIRI